MRFSLLGKVSLIASQVYAVSQTTVTQTVNYSTFDQNKLGTESERFFLAIGALKNLMTKVITDVHSVNTTFDDSQMKELRESLACVESLARLFPDDLQESVAEMVKITSGFLNHSVDATQE